MISCLFMRIFKVSTLKSFIMPKKTTDSVRCSLIYILFLKFYKIKFTSKQKYSHYETGMFMY